MFTEKFLIILDDFCIMKYQCMLEIRCNIDNILAGDHGRRHQCCCVEMRYNPVIVIICFIIEILICQHHLKQFFQNLNIINLILFIAFLIPLHAYNMLYFQSRTVLTNSRKPSKNPFFIRLHDQI